MAQYRTTTTAATTTAGAAATATTAATATATTAATSEYGTDLAWLNEALEDVDQWAVAMPLDAQGHPIDWRRVRRLNLAAGLGVASDQDLRAGAGSDLHLMLSHDYAMRNMLESILAQCTTAFMMDFDRHITSYRLPRALAYVNRRLNDEIQLLIDRGAAQGYWTVSTERQGRSNVTVLHREPLCPFAIDDIQDDTALMQEARAAYRSQQNAARATANATNRAYGASTITNPPSAAPTTAAPASASRSTAPNHGQYGRSDWRDAYLPGRSVDMVMGIDIETTGIDPARVYIIDVGFEYMNMRSPRPANAPGGFRYEQHYYTEGDAYGQARLRFGVTARNSRHGNPLIADLTGIDVRAIGPNAGLKPFDEYPDAQHALLTRLIRQPYVAHNATFEHSYFMLNIAGYAEHYRNGDITIIDTLPMSKRWDAGSAPDEAHPYGSNTLDAYAKRQGALATDKAERHLGLEDTHIMLVAMKHHLNVLRQTGQGPWAPDGKPGIGGKYCRKRR